jgi:YidC/Oxa1 family membrane protein insertase
MEPADQRNMLLALVLCFGLFALYNVFVLEPQQQARREAMARSQEQTVATAPSTTQAIRPRDDIIREETAAGTRVAIDAPAIDGSVSLKGGRIDDVSLKNFYETIQDKLARRKAGEVHLLSPAIRTAPSTPSSTGRPAMLPSAPCRMKRRFGLKLAPAR